MTPATPLERNDIISRWTGDCIVPGSETAADAALRLANAMDILDDVPADILSEAYKLARRVGGRGFAPDPGAVHDIAGPMMKERLIDLRIEREARAYRTAPALIEYVEPDEPREKWDSGPILAHLNAKLEEGYFATEGRPMPGARKVVKTGNRDEPLRMPTADELAEVARILANKPRVERMTITDADYSALGMGVAARA